MFQETHIVSFEGLAKSNNQHSPYEHLKTSSINSSGYWEDFESSKSYDLESTDLGSMSSAEVVTFKWPRPQKNCFTVNLPNSNDTCSKKRAKGQNSLDKLAVSSEIPSTMMLQKEHDQYYFENTTYFQFPPTEIPEVQIIDPERFHNQNKDERFGTSDSCLRQVETNETVAADISPISRRLPYGENFCDSIETWLQDRPAWLYGRPKASRCDVFQFCFLTDSEQESDDHSATRDCDLELNPMPSDTESTPAVKEILIASPATVNSSNRDANTTTETEETENENPFYKPSSDEDISLNETRSCEGITRRLAKTNRYFEYYLNESKAIATDPGLQHQIEFLKQKHKSDHSRLELAISQIPSISRMQAEVERVQTRFISTKVQELLHLKVQCKHTELNLPLLRDFKVPQLQLIVNDIYSAIEVLNDHLIKELADRDELYLAQRARLTEIEDISAYGQELCRRCGIRKLRRSTLTQPMIAADFMHLRPIWMTGRIHARRLAKLRSAQPPQPESLPERSKTLDVFRKQLINMFSREKRSS